MTTEELGRAAYYAFRRSKQGSAARFLASGLGWAAKNVPNKAVIHGLTGLAGTHKLPLDRRRFLQESVWHLLNARDALNKPGTDAAENLVRRVSTPVLPAGRSMLESVATNPATAVLAATNKNLPTWARFLAGGGLASAGYGIYEALNNK